MIRTGKRGGFGFSEWRHGRMLSLLFAGCIAMAVSSYSAVEILKGASVTLVNREARTFLAADLAVASAFDFSENLKAQLKSLNAAGMVKTARVTRMLAMGVPDTGRPILVSLKAVAKGYPFYGEVKLGSGQSLSEVLVPQAAIVDAMVLRQMDVEIGDRISIGDGRFQIVDTIKGEPDRPVEAIGLAPRVMISHTSLAETGLVRTGSRIRHEMRIKLVGQSDLASVRKALLAAALPGTEEVRTWETAGSRLVRIFDHLFYYLSLTAVGILALGGFGIRGSLTALLGRKTRSVAVMKALGATDRYVYAHMLGFLLRLAIPALFTGWLMGLGIAQAMIGLMGPLVPEGFSPVVTPGAVFRSMVLGLGVTLAFALIPLSRISRTPPVHALREGAAAAPGRVAVLFTALVAFLVLGSVGWILGDAGSTRNVILGGIMAGAFAMGASFGFVRLLHKIPVKGPRMRVAMEALGRNGATPFGTISAIGISIGIVLGLWLVEANLSAVFLKSFPEDAPNLYIVDIQPDQKEGVLALTGEKAQFFSMVRARVTGVNETPIDPVYEQKKKGDNLSREFTLTWHGAMPDERLVEGDTLFQEDGKGMQVSVLDYIRNTYPISVGDVLEFRVQGVPFSATVSSIRKRKDGSLRPFFVFVFREKDLVHAPHTWFAAVSASEDRMLFLEKELARSFPNLRLIDIRSILSANSALFGRLFSLLQVFSAFGFISGGLVWLGGVAATRAERAKTAILLRICGADNRFLMSTALLETGIMGGVAAVLGFLLAEMMAALVCIRGFGIDFNPKGLEMALFALAAMVVICIAGVVAALPSLLTKPADAVRKTVDG